MVYIGVDLGGTGIKAGVVDEQGNILAKDSCPTGVERGYAAVIEDIAGLCTRVASRAVHDMSEVKAIGIGLPGIYVPSTGRVPFCTNLGWHDVPLLAEMRKYTDLPVFADNDATVAGLAEAVAGVSKGCNVSIFVTLGTGVGGGIIMGGKAYSGPHGIASEIGHMITVAGGEQCTCGNKGCWERYASATAIIREGRRYAKLHPDCAILKAVDGDASKIEARTVIDLAKQGDPASMEIFDQYVYHLCVGLVNLINLYDPEIIALGGGVSHAGQFLLDRVNAILPGLVFYKTMPYAEVKLAALGNDAGIIGAAMLGR
ncbi:MAG: ROK family protein [Clostridiales bacterium]|nr:ROK family protein [Clostridiales bacterium]